MVSDIRAGDGKSPTFLYSVADVVDIVEELKVRLYVSFIKTKFSRKVPRLCLETLKPFNVEKITEAGVRVSANNYEII